MHRGIWCVLAVGSFCLGLAIVAGTWLAFLKPADIIWTLVSEERVPGQKIDLVCIQEANRAELVSAASVPLEVGDQTRTICTVVSKGERP